MEHAWLDSLSEDWVSQAGSDRSASVPAHSLPTSVRRSHPSSLSKAKSSRLPRPGEWIGREENGISADNSSNILGERSANDVNIPKSHRTPSKLSREITLHGRSRHASRSVSASTTDSVIHNTVQHRANSLSPQKSKGQTPEWKRRLVYGNLAYGEHKDLFSSAGTGLENMFRPPVVGQAALVEETREYQAAPDETTMPSSPPFLPNEDSVEGSELDGSIEYHPQEHNRPVARTMGYRRTEEYQADRSDHSEEEGRSGFSADSRGSQEPNGSSALSSVTDPSAGRASRKFSSQSTRHYEDFSPIMVSPAKPTVVESGVGHPELPPEELQRRLEHLRWNQKIMADGVPDGPEGNSASLGQESFDVEDTEAYERAGGFINFRRGGRSAEGSFRHRVLSPPLNTDTSDMLPEESLQASTPKQYPTFRADQHPRDGVTPPLPRAPHPSPTKSPSGRNAAAGSPLKLFGPYDTFTNQTLMRRISQFEDQMSNQSKASQVQYAASRAEYPVRGENRDARLAGPEEAAAASAPAHRSSAQFGAGELEGYEFHDDFSRLSQEVEETDDDISADGPPRGAPRPSAPLFHFDVSRTSSPDGDDLFVLRQRGKAGADTSITGLSGSSVAFGGPSGNLSGAPATPRRPHVGSESKRPRTSPSKDPTPKRRRTLHKSDVAYGVEATAESTQSSRLLQSATSRKRRDARDGDLQQAAHPGVLAGRQILRPRTPTPSQRSSVHREEHARADTNKASQTKPRNRGEQAHPPRGSPSRFGGPLGDADRKPSIKTEDFMNEANKIMEMLRNRGARPSGGLASVEESESEHMAPRIEDHEGSFQESTREPFSRPPSREGRPVPRASTRQDDPELVARLKKYEERSDLEGLVSSSVRSLGLAHDAIEAANVVEEQVRHALRRSSVRLDVQDDGVVSDPPNIRISTNPSGRRGSRDLDDAGAQGDGFPTQGSASSDHSTGRSIPTGSSRGSDSRKTIAPQTVSHLIPEQVGSMAWDKQKNAWVKTKHTTPRRSTRNVLLSEASEDDPFADIPDLTVDVTRELQNLRVANLLKGHEEQGGHEGEEQRDQEDDHFAQSPTRSAQASPSRKPILLSPASRPSGTTRERPVAPSRLSQQVFLDAGDDVEHEISIHEGRDGPRSPSKRRNLTISFSSPIASIIQDIVVEESGFSELEDVSCLGATAGTASGTSTLTARGRRKVSLAAKPTKSDAPTRPRSTSRGPQTLSVRRHAFVPRPVSRIEERDEDAGSGQAAARDQDVRPVGDHPTEPRRASLSFVVTTPGPPKPPPPFDHGRTITQYVGTLSLSPLSDFTVHPDRSAGFEASYLLGDRRLVTGSDAEIVMSQTLRDLVDRITEVEPFEPYWEEMTELDLPGKRLSSLHKLDEFCRALVTLDASHNDLRNLGGVPPSVRHLKLVQNRFTELTSWVHLPNLQYLDVSNNKVKTLSGLKGLVHLRSLKVDNCGLTNLDALRDHDALQSLRARDNQIQDIDLDGNGLCRLTELDLEGNQLRSITHLDQLPSLTSLNLRRNRLEALAIAPGRTLSALRTLDLSDNCLAALDVRPFPSLRVLHADRNQLVRLSGFSKTPRLDSLSLREQTGEERLDVSSLYHAYEIRKLYLSGNLLETFDPPVEYLNLQLLEMANCGLTALPETLGMRLPNLRKLNLNFNALSDLRFLETITRLKRLSVAGNRLASAVAVVDVLEPFRHLAELDLRDNAITLGFYAPLKMMSPKEAKEVPAPFTLPRADVAWDQAYSKRLDLVTGMRRRIYETILAKACGKLKMLDGMPLRRDIGSVRDAVWMALVTDGILIDAEGECAAGNLEEDTTHEQTDGSRWGAEDSFA